MPSVRNHLRGNVVGYVALFFAFGGVAYAAGLPRDSVGPAQIQEDAVRSPEIKQNAVKSSEIRRDAVKSSEIAANGVRSQEVKDGTLGCRDFNPTSPVCQADEVGFTDVAVRPHTETIELTCTETHDEFMDFYTLECQGEENAKAACEPGEQATGGGYGEPGANVVLKSDRPDPASGTADGWIVKAEAHVVNWSFTSGATPPPDPDVTVYALCAA